MFITNLVVNMVLHRQFILASNSLSRYRLLKAAGLNFIKIPPLCNEHQIKEKLQKNKIALKSYSRILAKEKAISVSNIKTNFLVVGSDTVIIFENKVVDKANNLIDAKNKLKKLSGKKHLIISGVSVCLGGKQIWSCSQSSTILMKKINDIQIKNYLKQSGKEILSSVGCYQAEKLGPQIIASIKGDFFNVLGFPLFPFINFLENNKI